MLDHALDPSTVISALAKANIRTIESVLRTCPLLFFLQIHYAGFYVFFSQVSKETLKSVKETINGAGNVNIVPIHVAEEVSRLMFKFFFTEFSHFQKRRVTENALMEMAQDRDEEWDV